MLSASPRFTRLLKWPVPIPPQPMTAKRIRSFAPNTAAFEMAGTESAAAAKAVVLTKWRRETAGVFMTGGLVLLIGVNRDNSLFRRVEVMARAKTRRCVQS